MQLMLQADDGLFEVQSEGNIVGVFLVRQGVPGVVIMKCGAFYCATCRKTYCDHARHLSVLHQNEQNIPPIVERLFTSGVQTSVSNTNHQYGFSKKSISFCPTEEMATALKKLCVADPSTSLSPSDSFTCCCGNDTFVASVLYEAADLITLTSISKVEGKRHFFYIIIFFIPLTFSHFLSVSLSYRTLLLYHLILLKILVFVGQLRCSSY